MKEIDTKILQMNPFSLIEDGWFLITSVQDEKINTMTAASGSLGHMFRKNVAYIHIRKERYTHSFVDSSNILSLCFFPNTPENKKILSYLGTTSGEHENKLEKIPYHLAFDQNIPYFLESSITFLCRVLYKAPIISEGFIDKDVENYYYPQKDYHDLYIVEIMKTLVAE